MSSRPHPAGERHISASIDVGTQIPTLSSQALVGGTQVNGSNLFANTIENVDTGVLLTITPRVNSSGGESANSPEVSAPTAATSGGIQSPASRSELSKGKWWCRTERPSPWAVSFKEPHLTKNRVPLLGDIPYVGRFGNYFDFHRANRAHRYAHANGYPGRLGGATGDRRVPRQASGFEEVAAAR